MKKTNYHVTKHSHGWQYKKAGAKKATGVVSTQGEAERLAKKIVKNQGGGEVRIHGRDGKIRDTDTISPANDPFPPRDKKF
jgi:hypothetical protein